MIIDSHEHLMITTESQIEKMEKAGVDKAILFCTAPHPEKADSLDELKREMETLYRILGGSNTKEANISRNKKNILELAAVLKDIRLTGISMEELSVRFTTNRWHRLLIW